MLLNHLSPRFLALPLIATALLLGCVPPAENLDLTTRQTDASDCATRSGGPGCHFVNSPVQLAPKAIKLPNRPYVFYATARRLQFQDGAGRAWEAPTATLTDGASIPPLFVPLIGDPRTPEFANAAALHDAYCGVGNEDGANWHNGTWQAVHRMFYDTLVVSGTGDFKAKVMFAAVWLGGPRWYPSGKPDVRFSQIPDSMKTEAMQTTISFIKLKKPSIAQLIRYLEWKEREMYIQFDFLDAARDANQGTGANPGSGVTSPINNGGSQNATQP